MSDAYQRYTARMREAVETRGMAPVPALLRKGEVLVWSAGLVHGGANVVDYSRTRKSITTHYFLPGFEKIWSPAHTMRAGKLVINTWNRFLPQTPPRTAK